MKLKRYWLLTLALTGLLCVIGWTGSAQKQNAKRTAWEYKIVTYTSEEAFNELGAQGWELVTVSETREGVSGIILNYCFKRAK
jgi:hypothetical protein